MSFFFSSQKYFFLCDMMRYFNAIMKMYINAKNQQKYVYNPKKFSNLLNEIHWVIWLERHAIKRQTTWQAQNVKQESSLHVLYLLFIVTIFMNLIFKKSFNIMARQTHRGPNWQFYTSFKANLYHDIWRFFNLQVP